jgi:predicted transcriptional regulator
MKNKKVVLIVESTKQSFDRAFSLMAKPSKKYAGIAVISFPDFETLGKVITGARVQLLSVIRAKKPSSIHELARMVDRDFKNVYQDVKLLAQFGLIELKEQGPRKAATPTAKYSELVLAA